MLWAGDSYKVSLADSGEKACEVLDNALFDLVITDIRMKDVDGIEVLKKAKETSPETMVVMISAFATAETAVEAMREGAYDYIPKPFEVEEFKKIVQEALKSKRSTDMEGKEEAEKGRFHFGCLIGESAKMRKIYDLIERVAQTKSNILVSGESGTGKELVAGAIHRQSKRKGKPFVVINCAGIPETLIESELFGYKKGASGYMEKDGKPLKVQLLASNITVAGSSVPDRDGEILKQQFQDAGIQVDLINMEQTTTDVRIRKWDFQLAISGHGGLLGDAMVRKNVLASSSGSPAILP